MMKKKSRIATFLVYIVLVLFMCSLFGWLGASYPRPGQPSLGIMLAITGFIVLPQILTLGLGPAATYFHGPAVDNLLPAPIMRSSLVQHRARGMVRGAVWSGVIAAAVGAFLLSQFVALDPWWLTLRLLVVLIPLFGAPALAGIIMGDAYFRLDLRTQKRCDWALWVTIPTALFLSLPSITFLDLHPLDDPLILAYVAYATPIAKFIGGFPLDAGEFVILVTWWLLFVLVAWVAVRRDYQAYAYTAWQPGHQAGQLTQEVKEQSELRRRVRKALRPPYIDIGEGAWAVASKNLTASLRFPHSVFAWMMVGLLAPMLLFLALLGSGQLTTFMVMIFSPMFVLFGGAGVQSVASSGDRENVLAQVPLTNSGLLVGYCIPPVFFGAAWSAFFMGLILLGGGAAADAALIGALTLSLSLLFSTYQVLGLRHRVDPKESGEINLMSSGWAAAALNGAAMLLFLGEWMLLLIGSLLLAPFGLPAGFTLAALTINLCLAGLAALFTIICREPTKG